MALFRTAQIIKASKLPPEGVRLSRMIDAVYFLPIAYLGVFATFHMHFDLLAGDWDFWIDWKDRQFWMTVTPIVEVAYPGAVMYYFWTFYRQPSPEADPYVKEGDAVKEGDVVGLIEIMKTFHEIRSDADGVVARFLVDNEELVDAGQDIIALEPG